MTSGGPGDGRTWGDYFRDLRAEREPAEAPVVEEARVTLVEDDPDTTWLGRSQAGLIARIREAGWGSRVRRTAVWRPTTYYVTGERAGELKKEAHETIHWFIAGWWTRAGVAFRAAFTETRRTKTVVDKIKAPLKSKIPKRLRELDALSPVAYEIRIEGPIREREVPASTFTFDGATAVCPIGEPRELYFDYEPDALSLKGLTNQDKERAYAKAMVRRTAYNDGADYLDHRPSFAKVGDLDNWLTDWLDIAASAAQRKETAA